MEYAVRGGGFLSTRSATFGEDYRGSTSGTLIFEPGQTEKTIELEIIDDDEPERLENIFINLSDRSNPPVNVGTSQAEIVIIDDDQ